MCSRKNYTKSFFFNYLNINLKKYLLVNIYQLIHKIHMGKMVNIFYFSKSNMDKFILSKMCSQYTMDLSLNLIQSFKFLY
jgi:hypothetical protein